MNLKARRRIAITAMTVFLVTALGTQMVLQEMGRRTVKDTEKEKVNLEKEVTKLEDYISNKEKEDAEKSKQEDINILARLIYAEAGNQSILGRQAVAQVVLNRVKSWKFPNTIKEVINQKSQFHGVYSKNFYEEPTNENLKIAEEIINGKKVIPEDVVYFKTNTDPTKWKMKVYTVIDNHTFYYDEGSLR